MEDDLVSRLFDRGLIHIVEDILLFTSARTVAACLRVCRCWHAHLTEHNVWRLLYVKMFRRRRQFRRLCCHNGWLDHVPGQGAKTTDLAIYRRILYKSTCFREIWCEECLLSTKLYTGYLISCLKVFRSLLFAGMQDGQIKVWVIRDPVRNTKAFRVLEGHEECVTSMDAVEDSLVSASVEHQDGRHDSCPPWPLCAYPPGETDPKQADQPGRFRAGQLLVLARAPKHRVDPPHHPGARRPRGLSQRDPR